MGDRGPIPVISTRAAAIKPLIGHSLPDVPPRRLPKTEDVLRVLTHAREQPGCQKKGPKDFSCPINKEFVSQCLLPGGCGERETPCLLLRIVLPYRKAGIITISDRAIQQRIISLGKQYQKIRSKIKIKTAGVVAIREKFVEEISKTWNIADPNARKVILNDESRSEDAKKEDIEFFDDNFGPNAERKMEMAGRDEDYDRELLSSLLSEEAKENKRQERERQKTAARDKEKEQSKSRMQKVSL
jgi:hypothetical protein